jgi:hypothetical protein
MPDERMSTNMRARLERYEETVQPSNPPQSTGAAPAVIAGLWYYLAPLALVILLLAFALIYWEDRNSIEQPVEPTTGPAHEVKPGGNPNREPRSTEDEINFRGNR